MTQLRQSEGSHSSDKNHLIGRVGSQIDHNPSLGFYSRETWRRLLVFWVMGLKDVVQGLPVDFPFSFRWTLYSRRMNPTQKEAEQRWVRRLWEGERGWQRTSFESLPIAPLRCMFMWANKFSLLLSQCELSFCVLQSKAWRIGFTKFDWFLKMKKPNCLHKVHKYFLSFPWVKSYFFAPFIPGLVM